ncbi:hypothetical protein PIB30_018597 [Stylosanthes scabra]|uniref:Uncharacterized protein n=1 Tax=Stylosanthes scabra TaxID=79078 RepID=A0ABU6S7H7_9FABA|nr:hypothetical protein [Stylosanthes scabra]
MGFISDLFTIALETGAKEKWLKEHGNRDLDPKLDAQGPKLSTQSQVSSAPQQLQAARLAPKHPFSTPGLARSAPRRPVQRSNVASNPQRPASDQAKHISSAQAPVSSAQAPESVSRR